MTDLTRRRPPSDLAGTYDARAGLRARPRARLPLLVGPGRDQPDGRHPRRGLATCGTATGKRYLDFTSQLVFTNLGHQHPRIVAAIQEQAAHLCTIAPAVANGARSEAARLIASHTPGDLDQVFFTNGGADANEHAVRMARLHTGRHKVLSTYRRYHGGTQLAVNMTGDPRRWANDHGSAGTVHFFGPFLYRSAFHATTEAEECERALEHLEQVVALEGPSTIAAIVLEAIPGTAGIMVPPPGYLAGVREICDRHGIVLVADEVMSGFGRAGPLVRRRARDGVVARPADLRQGRELRLRPARRGRHQRRDPRDLRPPHLPRRAHLLGPPAGVRRGGGDDPRDGGRRRRRPRRPSRRRGARSRPPRARRPARVDRRGARHRGLLGARAGQRPGDPGAARALRRLAARRWPRS